MAAKARRLYSNFSKGELSPLLDGRPDLAGYFEGGRTALNWYLLRQGGLVRRPGSRFANTTAFSTLDSILIPFEFSVDDAFVLEFGDHYIRFYKDDLRIESSPGLPYELVSPYGAENLRTIHVTQSADVLFIFHPLYQQRRLSRIADTNWVIQPISYRPPPSFEADTDISDDIPGGPLSPPNPPIDIPGPPETPPDGGQPTIPPTDTSGGGSGGE